MTREAREHSFDALARGLASGSISRRKALRMLGATLVGGLLASVPGVAWAAKGGNRECVKCCKENFPPGPERGQCISAGARGECPVTCAAACPPSRVELSNGTCALPCDRFDVLCLECGCVGGCVRVFPPPEEFADRLCYNEGPLSARCQIHADCPSGQFCAALEEPPSLGFCVEACPGELCN